MPKQSDTDFLSWVNRVNNRWIVHEGLNKTANAYLEHLKQTDPDRLLDSCRAAYKLTHSGDVTEDPKPRFYGALFSRATREEANRFLQDHWFISSIIPATCNGTSIPPGLARSTLDQIKKLRRDIAATFTHPPHHEDTEK